MKKRTRKLLWILLCLSLFIFLSLSGIILFLMVTEYKPEPMTTLGGNLISAKPVPGSARLTFLTWNIGYAGLGKEMDFFYEGGTKVRPSGEQYDRYISGISNFLAGQVSADFIFLQEVDKDAKRSYHKDQEKIIGGVLNDHYSAFAINYNCRFVPVPLHSPMGGVISGIAAFSRFSPARVVRHSYEAMFPWPKRLVFLKRCFLEERFPLANGKDLVIVNLHNSTYDEGGFLRNTELAQLKEFIDLEWEKRNYIVIGGDWNMNPRGFIPMAVATGDKVHSISPGFSEIFLPGWQFAYDPTSPTNRDVNSSYIKGKTGTTIIDFFVVSPNISVLSVETLNTGFEYSDHLPVRISIRLNE